MVRQVNPAQLARFCEMYGPNLERAVREKGDEYAFQIEEVPQVLGRMRAALERGSYNHAGHALRWTCKELGLKHTRRAIEAFLVGGAA